MCGVHTATPGSKPIQVPVLEAPYGGYSRSRNEEYRQQRAREYIVYASFRHPRPAVHALSLDHEAKIPKILNDGTFFPSTPTSLHSIVCDPFDTYWSNMNSLTQYHQQCRPTSSRKNHRDEATHVGSLSPTSAAFPTLFFPVVLSSTQQSTKLPSFTSLLGSLK
jgi:hypothetical protein